MPYLVDTCVLSELRRPRCDPAVLAWFEGVSSADLYLSVITVGEIRRGIELHRTKDPVAAAHLERWLIGLERHYSDRVLPITGAIADRWGRLSLHQPMPVSDGLIAATALEEKLTLVTRNVKDFARSGVPLVDPFTRG